MNGRSAEYIQLMEHKKVFIWIWKDYTMKIIATEFHLGQNLPPIIVLNFLLE